MIKIILNFFLLFFFMRFDHNGTPTCHKRTHQIDKKETQSLLPLMTKQSGDHLNSNTRLLRSKI